MADESAEPDGAGRHAAVVVAAVVVAVAILVGVLVAVDGGDPGPVRDRRGEAEVVADEWLRAWSADDRPAMRDLLAEPVPSLDPVLDGFRDGLQPGLITAAGGAAAVATVATGRDRVRAGFPVDWVSGDKTGTGIDVAKHTYVDLAFGGPIGKPPIIVTAYFEPERLAEPMDPISTRVLADIGRLAADSFRTATASRRAFIR